MEVVDGHMQRGHVRYNEHSSYNWTSTSREALACQEIGHAIGLDHRSSTASCMYQNAAVASPTPDWQDHTMLDGIYNYWDGDPQHPEIRCHPIGCSGPQQQYQPKTGIFRSAAVPLIQSFFDRLAALEYAERTGSELEFIIHF